MKKEKIFYYGGVCFRPPNPPRSQHRSHLEMIKKELGFNVVRVWCLWNACHRDPEVFDFSEYEEIMSICDELELNVVFQTVLEDAPYWLEQAHPECRYVNSRGKSDELSSNDSRPTGGHPGLCLDNPVVVKQAERFLKAVAESIKGHPSLLAYDCWNEPHIEPCWNTLYWADMGDLLYCYCPGSIKKFREWLRNKYKTIEAINSSWRRYYGNWQQINPPRRHGSFADWLDWWRFWFDNLQGQMKWRYETLKKVDPDHLVISHSGGVPPILPRIEAGINNYTLAKEVDMWGTSFAPLAQNWSSAEAAAVLDMTRSVAPDKECWIGEMQAGPAHNLGLNKSPRPQPRHIRTWNWLAVAYGMKGIIYWRVLEENTGNEAQGFGLVRFSGEITDRAREAARNFKLFQKYEHIFMDHVPASDVAILYEPDSSTIMFAQEGHDRWISASHVSYYRTIWDADLYARWVNFENLATVKEKVLIVPMHYLITKEAASILRCYVENGGTLIAENSFGLFDHNGMLQPQIPSYGLSEVFGLEEEENYFTWPDYESTAKHPLTTVGSSFFERFVGPYNEEIHSGPEITLWKPIKTKFRAYGFLTPLRLKTAKSLGGWKDYCLAAHNKFGKGEAYYFGTFLGLSMFNRDKGAGKVIANILSQKIRSKVRGKNLRPRLIDAGKEALLVIFNNSRFESYTEIIAIPDKFSQVFNIHTEKKMTVKDGAVKVTVEREDVAVLHLS